jgi:hypothetical protein
MLTGGSMANRKKGQISAATLGLILCAGALATRAADYGSADSLSAAAPLYCYFRDATHSRTADLVARVPLEGAPAQPAGPSRGATACIRAGAGLGARAAMSPSDTLTRLQHAFGTDPRHEVPVRNADALLRANMRLTLGEEWLGFVYADMGAVDSALRWQGLAGIRTAHGVDLIGGWRHVTYHFTPGRGFDSLEFDGPYLGAALAW